MSESKNKHMMSKKTKKIQKQKPHNPVSKSIRSSTPIFQATNQIIKLAQYLNNKELHIPLKNYNLPESSKKLLGIGVRDCQY